MRGLTFGGERKESGEGSFVEPWTTDVHGLRRQTMCIKEERLSYQDELPICELVDQDSVLELVSSSSEEERKE